MGGGFHSLLFKYGMDKTCSPEFFFFLVEVLLSLSTPFLSSILAAAASHSHLLNRENRRWRKKVGDGWSVGHEGKKMRKREKFQEPSP